jgi:hypothetical protein
MTALIQPGTEVRPYLAPDGTTQVRCPSCSHYIPHVAAEALTITEYRPTAAMIACRCPLGEGTNAIGRSVECPCHAVFRLRPEGMQRYIVVEGWQEEATPESLMTLEMGGIVDEDGTFHLEEVSVVQPKSPVKKPRPSSPRSNRGRGSVSPSPR